MGSTEGLVRWEDQLWERGWGVGGLPSVRGESRDGPVGPDGPKPTAVGATEGQWSGSSRTVGESSQLSSQLWHLWGMEDWDHCCCPANSVPLDKRQSSAKGGGTCQVILGDGSWILEGSVESWGLRSSVGDRIRRGETQTCWAWRAYRKACILVTGTREFSWELAVFSRLRWCQENSSQRWDSDQLGSCSTVFTFSLLWKYTVWAPFSPLYVG